MIAEIVSTNIIDHTAIISCFELSNRLTVTKNNICLVKVERLIFWLSFI